MNHLRFVLHNRLTGEHFEHETNLHLLWKIYSGLVREAKENNLNCSLRLYNSRTGKTYADFERYKEGQAYVPPLDYWEAFQEYIEASRYWEC